MSKLRERLQDPTRSGVYRAGSADAIEDALRGSRLQLTRISLASARDKDELLRRIAGALDFPAWFGASWDALEDCLGDLSWRPAEGHVLLFAGAADSDELGILVDVLASSAQFWAARGRPFFAVFLGAPGALALAPLYREA